MDHAKAILRDLVSGPATASAIGERVPIPADAITIILRRYQEAGIVEGRELPAIGRTPTHLFVWKLTEQGSQFVADGIA